ncbi:hypothetical protein J4443_00050 [Candidatus Woesearchaeota archaeon]|nr:hypothetical protein [Candidatus Woesearchaeota archaeon]
MNKRGFIRTLEAVAAIIIVFLFIYYAGRNSQEDTRFVQGIRSLQESILDDVGKNDDFRECIVNSGIADFNQIVEGFKASNCINIKQDNCAKDVDCYIEGSLPLRYKERYAFTICSPSDLGSCSLPGSIGGSKEVYTSAVIISSSLKNEGKYGPRILRMWLY